MNKINAKQVKNLMEIAAVLIKNGEATIDNAFLKAIELDNKNIVWAIESKSNQFTKSVGFAGYNSVEREPFISIEKVWFEVEKKLSGKTYEAILCK